MMVSTKIKTSGINACHNPEKFMMVMGKIEMNGINAFNNPENIHECFLNLKELSHQTTIRFKLICRCR